MRLLPPLPLALSACLLASWTGLPAEAQASTVDPFVPGKRWSHPAPPATPWIPRDVAFAGHGEWVLAGPAVGTPHLVLLGSEGANADELFVDLGPSGSGGAVGPLLVRAGDDPDELFSVVQFPGPSGRRTELARHDAWQASGSTFAPVWTYDPGFPTDRGALVACDPEGEALVCATYDTAAGLARVDWIDPASGVRITRLDATGASLAALALGADGARAALACGQEVWVLDRSGSTLLHTSFSAAPRALDLSADGRTLCVAGFGEVMTFVDGGAGFQAGPTLTGFANELPSALAVDAVGARAAVGWWDFATGLSVRLEVWDLVLGSRLVQRYQAGSPGSPQNFPQATAISPAGDRAAFGLWGAGDGRPDVLLIDVDGDRDVLSVDLPGSVQALALDATGTRVAVARKDAHANAFATTGAVELFETGERDLVLLAQPRLGGQLSLSASRPGHVATIYAVGSPATAVPLPWGSAYVDPGQTLHLFGVGASLAGVSTLDLSIPDLPALVGVPVAVQAVFAGPDLTVLSTAHVRPTVL